MKITKKLEEIYPDLLPDTYVIHSEGGWHFWKDVPEAHSIYRVKIWPFIQRINWPGTNDLGAEWRKDNRPEQVYTSMSPSHPYPYINLEGVGRRIKNAKNRKPQESSTTCFITMHGATARAFIDNPEKKPQVLHLNDDPSNYLLHNLAHGTNKDNHTDRGPTLKVEPSTVHAIFKLQGWAKG